ncbi:MAG: cation transporter [Phycisphaerae bacterium]|nr:cation transporter [Phycisphaerae bacterium]
MNTTTGTNQTATLAIDGMSCGHCVQAVTKALAAVPGVKVRSVAVGSAVIETADGWATATAVNALTQAGYSAKVVGDSATPAAAGTSKSGGGCCGGAGRATPDAAAGTKSSRGCCG